MGKVYPKLDERLRKFIAGESVFFVATAPCLAARGLGGDGDDGDDAHVNVSPKGYRDTFAVLGPTRVAYLDLTGSGAETIAHLRQNGKITIMFCSFDSAPKVLRLYGTGRVVLPADAAAPASPATRQPGRLLRVHHLLLRSRAGGEMGVSWWLRPVPGPGGGLGEREASERSGPDFAFAIFQTFARAN
jgi:Pyridoxamine 5'-phosphate oxidase